MVLAEITEGETVQMTAVSGIAEGAEIRIVRGFDAYRAARPHHPVEFFHSGHNVRHMFDHVDGQQPVEGTVPKWVGKAVEIAKDVGAGGAVPIDPDGSRLLVNPAAHVQYSRCSRSGGVGHSSRVSKAGGVGRSGPGPPLGRWRLY